MAFETLFCFGAGFGAILFLRRFDKDIFTSWFGPLIFFGCLFGVVIPASALPLIYHAFKKKNADLIGATIFAILCSSFYLFFALLSVGSLWSAFFGTVCATTCLWLCKALFLDMIYAKKMSFWRQLLFSGSVMIYFSLSLVYLWFVIYISGYVSYDSKKIALIVISVIVILELISFKFFPKYFLYRKMQQRKLRARPKKSKSLRYKNIHIKKIEEE